MLRLGVDCEDIERFRRLPFKGNKRFYRRIFTSREISYCISKRDPYPSFTARFAAKEAIIKALNFIGVKPSYRSVEIANGRSGRPGVRLLGPFGRKKYIKDISVEISMSHSRTSAMAFAAASDDLKLLSSYKTLFARGRYNASRLCKDRV